MSQALALVPGPIAPVQALKEFSVTLTLTADAYATPTGVTVDLTTILSNLGISPTNVVRVGASTPTGYAGRATLTKTSNVLDGKFTLRLWNGTSEIGDGAVTQTVNLVIMAAVA